MSRKFRTANYEETLKQTIRLEEALPPNHLARFVVDIIAQLDLSEIYARYAPCGGEALAPEILLGRPVCRIQGSGHHRRSPAL